MKKDKKTVILTVIGITALLISVIGAAYAYFRVNTENNFGTPKVDASAAALGNVKLVSTDSNLYLNLTRTQMMEENAGDYYAVTDPNGKPIWEYYCEEGISDEEFYSKTEPTIGYIEVTGDGIYNCDYEFEVTYEGNLKEVLEDEDHYTPMMFAFAFYDGEHEFNNQLVNNYYYFSELEFPLTISGTLNGLSSSNRTDITARLILENKSYEEQNYLMNKNMKLSIKAKSFSCSASKEIMKLNYLAKDVYDLSKDDELWSSGLKGDGYRFIGENPNNYICFGTRYKNECINNPDKYMYRIIGIFPDENNNGFVKLIKDEPLSVEYMWYSDSNADISWDESDLYNGINGEYFLTNSDYDISYYNIANWNYTVTNSESFFDGNITTSKEIYLDEMDKGNNVGEQLNSQIGLMYFSDYVLSLGKLDLDLNVNYNLLKTSWLYKENYEWTMTRIGLKSSYNLIFIVGGTDVVSFTGSSGYEKVRPVFYLNNTGDKYIEGTGSNTDPFIIKSTVE